MQSIWLLGASRIRVTGLYRRATEPHPRPELRGVSALQVTIFRACIGSFADFWPAN